MSRKHDEHWQSICGQRWAKGFLKKPSAKKAAGLLYLSRNQLRIMTGLLTVHCHWKGHLFKQGLVNSPKCDRCKQASETASHVLCDCETLATLRFRHLGRHFMKRDDIEDISVSKILHFVQGVGLLNEWAKGLQKRLIMVKVQGSLRYPPFCILLFYSILFYSMYNCRSLLCVITILLWM
jgi:hypothetical protein